MKKLSASNCSGIFKTSPRRTMAAFDALPARARRAIANSYFNWATQPFLKKSAHSIEKTILRSDLHKLKKDGSIEMEYAVIAERKDGSVCTVRRGFQSARAAEDHPIILSEWKRVWVAPVGLPTVPKEAAEPTETVLPPKPWDWVASGAPSSNGTFHAYLVDATGRKIAAVWGRGKEKEMIADHIISLANGIT